MKQFVAKLKNGPMRLEGARVLSGRGRHALIESEDPSKVMENPQVIALEENQTIKEPDTLVHDRKPSREEIRQQKWTWGQLMMNLRRGWEVRHEGPVKVAVLDTGMDMDHPDLPEPKMAQSFVDGEGPNDVRGHGTHVCGTIAALHNGTGVSGVAPEVELYVAKIFSQQGGATLFNIVSALEWCRLQGIQIINASWGGGSRSDLMKDAIGESGALFVNAAGNSGTDMDKDKVFPGSYKLPNMLVVSAVDRMMMRPWWSNYGFDGVDVSAPGAEVLSTTNDGEYGLKSGTSMACPHVAAAAALLWSGSVEATKKKVMESGFSLFWMRSQFVAFMKQAEGEEPGQDPER